MCESVCVERERGGKRESLCECVRERGVRERERGGVGAMKATLDGSSSKDTTNGRRRGMVGQLIVLYLSS